MNLEMLVELEIQRVDWASIREADGSAVNVPNAIRELLAARSSQEVNQAYWKLENHVVVQGQIFEAAVYTVPVLMAALTLPGRLLCVRIGLMELLFQILKGMPHQEEVDRGLDNLAEQCKGAARCGLWLLYRELFCDAHDAAWELIELLDDNKSRVAFLMKQLRDKQSGNFCP